MGSGDARVGLWQQEVWDILLTHIERGMVIPVIGPELAVIRVGDEDRTVDQYVAHQLATKLDIPVGRDVDGDGRFTLNDVGGRGARQAPAGHALPHDERHTERSGGAPVR